jgi:predicted PurR-regulated permease PerM
MSARNVVFWLGLLAGFVAVWVLLNPILPPFIAGLAIAYLLDPLVGRVQRLGAGRVQATALVAALFFVVAVVLIIVLVPVLQTQLAGLADRLVRASMELYDRSRPWLDGIVARFGAGGLANPGAGAGDLPARAVQWVLGVATQVLGGGLALFNVVSLIFITPVVAFYLMRDWPRIVTTVDAWLPRHHTAEIRALASRIDERLAGFVRGQAMVCLFLGIFYAVGLTLVGLDNGLLVGLLSGVLTFIPYVGVFVGTAAGLLIATFQYNDWLMVAVVFGVFMVGQFLESSFVTPKLVGERVGLHPVWMIFAVMAGGLLGGFSGVLLAVPIAAAIGELLRFALDKYKGSQIYAGAVVKPDEVGRKAGPP